MRGAFILLEKHNVRLELLLPDEVEVNSELAGELFQTVKELRDRVSQMLGVGFRVDLRFLPDVVSSVVKKEASVSEPVQPEKEEEETSEARLLKFLRSLHYTDEEAYKIIYAAAERLYNGVIPYPIDAAAEKELREHLASRPNRGTVDNLVEFYAEATGRADVVNKSYDAFFSLLHELKKKVGDYLRKHGRVELDARIRGKGEKAKIEEDWVMADYYFVRHLISTSQI